jgi:NAD(P)-dependent dehydrogenase (short-subunit alcohol dehydrogenase family)
MKPKAEVALVTGGSSGIARETANILAQEGAKLDSAVNNASTSDPSGDG